MEKEWSSVQVSDSEHIWPPMSDPDRQPERQRQRNEHVVWVTNTHIPINIIQNHKFMMCEFPQTLAPFGVFIWVFPLHTDGVVGSRRSDGYGLPVHVIDTGGGIRYWQKIYRTELYNEIHGVTFWLIYESEVFIWVFFLSPFSPHHRPSLRLGRLCLNGT